MIKGRSIRLRLVRDDDLARLFEFHQDISNRGDYFPIGVASLPAFQAAYAEGGFWSEKKGMLIIASNSEEVIGHIEFFETVNYLDEIELSYILYSDEHRGQGIATEAVELLAGYLFGRKKVNRIRLMIHPLNAASLRVAEKAGFTREGLARGAWFHQGRNHDLEVWSLLRAEYVDRGLESRDRSQ